MISQTTVERESDARPVTLIVNGVERQAQLEPRVTLLDALREHLGLTGTKKGCDHGQCGACTVHVGGRRVLACLTLAVAAEGAPIATIEGLAAAGELHPMQRAFIECDALQCGYCTPGQIMSAIGCVNEGRTRDEAQIAEAMSGNLCRCGAYPNIRAATFVRRVSYTRSPDAATALTAGGAPSATFYAGGTTLIDLMKLDVLTPAALVDVNHLPLAAIERTGRQLRLGALARMSDAADDANVNEIAPAVAQALAASASAQLRNMASLGGNLMQRTRCAYFRDVETPCNKRRPGSGCGARDGINEEHAVLGISDDCSAVHASDFAVPLVAFDALLQVAGSDGRRTIPIAEFYREPGRTPERETALRHGELIEAIDLSATAASRNSVYLKVRDRTSYAFALASCAAGVERADDGTIADVRIALGGVATVPWRARDAEDALRGKLPGAQAFAAAARAAFAGAKPTLQNAYKIDLGSRTIVRALQAVCA